MTKNLDELELRVKELEDALAIQKVETSQALSFIANKFSEELQRLMDEYKRELKTEFANLVNSYRQH